MQSTKTICRKYADGNAVPITMYRNSYVRYQQKQKSTYLFGLYSLNCCAG